MTQSRVLLVVLLHTVVVWGAMVFRVDQFPLTWAPMYSTHVDDGEREFHEVFKNRPYLEDHGWLGVHADGSSEWITRASVNVPKRSMWRLYYERTWGKPPPKELQKNSGQWTLDRWIRGLPPGAPISQGDWERRLLVSINATLERTPRDPDFIVQLDGVRTLMRFDGDSLAPLGRYEERASIRWNDAWNGDLE